MAKSKSIKTDGSQKDYKFGPKNNWRRTVWNEVLSRTAGRERDEVILYLAGPRDIDRQIATSKGVPEQNLVAIDRDIDNVQFVRSEGYPALHGDFEEILSSWPDDRKVCAVLMDFCCGLTMGAVDVYDLLERRPFRNSVVMINMQRGRDAWSNEMRSQLSGQEVEHFDMLMAVSCWGYGPGGPPGSDCLTDKHRALVWLVFHAMDAWSNAAKGSLMDRIVATPGYQDGYEDMVGVMWSGNYFKCSNPRFYSYKSGALNFDSVVIDYPVGKMFEHFSVEDVAHYDATVAANHSPKRSIDMARKISAMLAVRTRRLAS